MKKKNLILTILLVASVVAILAPSVYAMGNSNNSSLREQAEKLEAKAPKDLPKRTLPKNCAVK